MNNGSKFCQQSVICLELKCQNLSFSQFWYGCQIGSTFGCISQLSVKLPIISSLAHDLKMVSWSEGQYFKITSVIKITRKNIVTTTFTWWLAMIADREKNRQKGEMLYCNFWSLLLDSFLMNVSYNDLFNFSSFVFRANKIEIID